MTPDPGHRTRPPPNSMIGDGKVIQAMRDDKGLWFLDSHITIQVSHADNADGVSVLLLVLDRDDAPPMHVHRNEDELFHVLDGQVRFVVDGTPSVADRGMTVLGPKGRPHGFRVVSDTARMLVIARGDFEGLVRSLSRPAEHDRPPPRNPPTPEMQAALVAACAAHGIDIVGPPIA